jgi:enoyl-CoA hydratase
MTQGFTINPQSYQRIAITREGTVLTLALSNGPVNAVDQLMHDELARVFFEAQDDSESDLIVLTGQGRAFCAGGATNWFREQVREPSRFRAIGHHAKRIVTSLLDIEKPVLCRLNGAAAGLGATLALMCDVIIAAETAVIGDPHVKVGLVAGDGGAIIWPQLIGFARAKELLMTGNLLTAQRAAEMGLINHVVPATELDSKVSDVASQILANPKWAVRWTKTVTNQPLKELAAKMSDAAIAYEMLSNETRDRHEAVEAFIARRKPDFTGS